jgi:SAM-dependent methyltransferase
MPDRPASPATAEVRAYWNRRIHDLEISSHPAGSPGFFADLDEYHFDKLHHLLELVDVRGGAIATGVDVADSAIALARENLRQQSLAASLCVGDGERLPFPDNAFDFVYAHGVVQYTPGDRALVDECRRVLKQGGTAFFQVYNRISWLNALSRVMKVGLEHEDAPVIRMYSPREFTGLLGGFSGVRVVYERFPVKSRLHGGWKGAIYNQLFVGVFNAIPKPLVRRFGWHLLAFCRK